MSDGVQPRGGRGSSHDEAATSEYDPDLVTSEQEVPIRRGSRRKPRSRRASPQMTGQLSGKRASRQGSLVLPSEGRAVAIVPAQPAAEKVGRPTVGGVRVRRRGSYGSLGLSGTDQGGVGAAGPARPRRQSSAGQDLFAQYLRDLDTATKPVQPPLNRRPSRVSSVDTVGSLEGLHECDDADGDQLLVGLGLGLLAGLDGHDGGGGGGAAVQEQEKKNEAEKKTAAHHAGPGKSDAPASSARRQGRRVRRHGSMVFPGSLVGVVAARPEPTTGTDAAAASAPTTRSGRRMRRRGSMVLPT